LIVLAVSHGGSFFPREKEGVMAKQAKSIVPLRMSLRKLRETHVKKLHKGSDKHGPFFLYEGLEGAMKIPAHWC
jgi:hypothetical protein